MTGQNLEITIFCCENITSEESETEESEESETEESDTD